jgi:hypothetical protein
MFTILPPDQGGSWTVSATDAPRQRALLTAKQTLLAATSSGRLDIALADAKKTVLKNAGKETLREQAKQTSSAATSGGRLKKAMDNVNEGKADEIDAALARAKQTLLTAASSGRLDIALADVKKTVLKNAGKEMLQKQAKQTLSAATSGGGFTILPPGQGGTWTVTDAPREKAKQTLFAGTSAGQLEEAMVNLKKGKAVIGFMEADEETRAGLLEEALASVEKSKADDTQALRDQAKQTSIRDVRESFDPPVRRAPRALAPESLRVVLVGCARDCGAYMQPVFRNISRIINMPCISEWKMVLFENDSKDETLAMLKEFQQIAKERMVVLCEKDLDNRYGYKTERMSYARNCIMEEIEGELGDFDILINIDMDDACSMELQTESLSSALQLVHTGEWGCVSFGRKQYYDMWAWRSAAVSTENCWADDPHYESMSNHARVQGVIRPAIEAALAQQQAGAPLEVDSAFGGFAVYSASAIRGCRYHHFDDAGEFDCEHVAFHRHMKANGARIGVLPDHLFDKYSNSLDVKPVSQIVLNDWCEAVANSAKR